MHLLQLLPLFTQRLSSQNFHQWHLLQVQPQSSHLLQQHLFSKIFHQVHFFLQHLSQQGSQGQAGHAQSQGQAGHAQSQGQAGQAEAHGSEQGQGFEQGHAAKVV